MVAMPVPLAREVGPPRVLIEGVWSDTFKVLKKCFSFRMEWVVPESIKQAIGSSSVA